MSTSNTQSLQRTLEAEYPLLDSSLIAAFISELPNDNDASIEDLRKKLSQLSMTAEVQQADSESQDIQTDRVDAGTFSSTPLDSEDIRGSESSPDDLSLSFSGYGTSRSSVASAATSATTLSVLEFLKMLFPNLSDALIQQALQKCNDIAPGSPILHEVSVEETDMSAIVDHLLNLEFIQDLTERGFEESDTEKNLDDWKVVTSKGKHSPKRIKSPKHPSTRPIALVDVRQRQHIAPPVRRVRPSFRPVSEDPWTRLMSLATRLSDLLPPTSPNYFMTYLHAPPPADPDTKTGWKAEGDSLRKAIADLVNHHPSRLDAAELQSHINALCDIVLHPESDDIVTLDPEQKYSLEADVRLCLAATQCKSDAALDLIWLLRELDQAFEDGDGIAHSAPLPIGAVIDRAAPAPVNANGQAERARGDGFKPSIVHPPPPAPPPSSRKHPPATSAWNVVKTRGRGNSRAPHPHAEFIPAYANPRKKAGRVGDNHNESVPGDDAAGYRRQVRDLQLQRQEALREAMRYWQNGNAKSRGGEVALYYAEKARKLQEEQRECALEAARVMVETKRMNSNERNTLDLHGLTVSEACQIVKETLQLSPASTAYPLKIITGLGRHSVGQIGVLGPAVKDMLQADGYIVSKFDGGLVVRG
ncbi:hypothetical protein BU17DRAFT_91316 [Hysterangium stoloniferum]|nr:hypothetical protein BU17DRAFT_91316 [Hysterangium stoloniferum]